jgi:peptidoglycan/xylan/chitin deacetylase (PgdA/CDA1 family)
MPDIFFARAGDKWLADESLPQEPLQQWTIADSRLDVDLGEPRVPVLFGACGYEMHDEGARLGLDIFGSCFFMLSRYEEAVSKQRDHHDRFPAHASLACRQSFLDRPIVDEYVEILWAAMRRLWPRLERKPRRSSTIVTCDVDHPYHPSAASVPRLIKRTAAEVIRKRTFSSGIHPLKNYMAARRGNWRNDVYYYTVDWMMDVNEKAGNKAAFYFIPEITDAKYDGACTVADPAVKEMLGRIARRGHEIGIHPGYNTYRSQVNLGSAVNALREVLDRQHINQEIGGGRQHFLRWSTHTPAIWDRAGLRYDSTLSFADYAGFRCGTCHEYPMYDLHHRSALKVRQRPLICMEQSVIHYMGYGLTEQALEAMQKLKKVVYRYHGDFVLLWHNSCFEADRAREMYCEVIRS